MPTLKTSLLLLAMPLVASSAYAETRTVLVTGYCPCRICCGSNARGVTASGKRVRPGMCAADRSIPFGTRIEVPGYGTAVVEDRGGAIRGRHIDLFFQTHAQAKAWGRRVLTVKMSRRIASGHATDRGTFDESGERLPPGHYFYLVTPSGQDRSHADGHTLGLWPGERSRWCGARE